MPVQRLLLVLILAIAALGALAPATRVHASSDPTAAAQLSSNQPSADLLRPVHTNAAGPSDFFPFNGCFTFSTFCNTGFFGGCFFGFCRPIFSGCFNFFNFGCRTFSPFTPFFNRFNFLFGSSVSCIQIMQMPGGGTVTVRVC
jgi:hypothetical protein